VHPTGTVCIVFLDLIFLIVFYKDRSSIFTFFPSLLLLHLLGRNILLGMLSRQTPWFHRHGNTTAPPGFDAPWHQSASKQMLLAVTRCQLYQMFLAVTWPLGVATSLIVVWCSHTSLATALHYSAHAAVCYVTHRWGQGFLCSGDNVQEEHNLRICLCVLSPSSSHVSCTNTLSFALCSYSSSLRARFPISLPIQTALKLMFCYEHNECFIRWNLNLFTFYKS
jgi:hypothetical protein